MGALISTLTQRIVRRSVAERNDWWQRSSHTQHSRIGQQQ